MFSKLFFILQYFIWKLCPFETIFGQPSQLTCLQSEEDEKMLQNCVLISCWSFLMKMDVTTLEMLVIMMTLYIVLSTNLYHILLLNDHRARMMIFTIWILLGMNLLKLLLWVVVYSNFINCWRYVYVTIQGNQSMHLLEK